MTVGEVIERLRAQGDAASNHGVRFKKPKPVPADVLATLKLPTGQDLPADLVEWLRYDGAWLKFLKKDGMTLRAKSLKKLLMGWLATMQESEDEDVEEELEELVEIVGEDVVGFWLKALPDPALARLRALQIPSAGDQEHLLVLEPGRATTRVLGCHKRIELWWKYDSLGAYLAHQLGFEEPAQKT